MGGPNSAFVLFGEVSAGQSSGACLPSMHCWCSPQVIGVSACYSLIIHAALPAVVRSLLLCNRWWCELVIQVVVVGRLKLSTCMHHKLLVLLYLRLALSTTSFLLTTLLFLFCIGFPLSRIYQHQSALFQHILHVLPPLLGHMADILLEEILSGQEAYWVVSMDL